MRSEDRIPQVLAEVATVWRENPDLRLGQLLYNACHYAGIQAPPCPGFFYMEDEKLLEGLMVMRDGPDAEPHEHQ